MIDALPKCFLWNLRFFSAFEWYTVDYITAALLFLRFRSTVVCVVGCLTECTDGIWNLLVFACCRDRQATRNANRKLEKKTKELQLQAEDEKRHAEQSKDQVRCYVVSGIKLANFGVL